MRAPSSTAALTALGISLRPEAEYDLAFSRQLFRELRWALLAPLALDETQAAALLAQQHDAQRQHYAQAGGEFLIIVEAERPIGRLCLNRRDPAEIRVVDISLLPAARNRGIGAAVLWAVMEEARVIERSVGLAVAPFNPARRLYERLGFVDAGAHGPDLRMVWRD